MSVKILVDMNLSPQWVTFFKLNGVAASHWSSIGEHTAKDSVIMDWSRKNGHTVFSHDLDFSRLLALTKATSPSVIQIRAQNILPEYFGRSLIAVIQEYSAEIEKGALIVLDADSSRLRILPLILPS